MRITPDFLRESRELIAISAQGCDEEQRRLAGAKRAQKLGLADAPASIENE
jgi:hypothetical protein